VAANAEAVAESVVTPRVEQPHLVTVPEHSTDDPLVVERHLVRRIVIGTVLAIPVGAALYLGLVALALAFAGTPSTAALLMGAGIGAYAALFWGFWFGIAASVREIEELEARARRRPRA
jgi:hypothetical protein